MELVFIGFMKVIMVLGTVILLTGGAVQAIENKRLWRYYDRTEKIVMSLYVLGAFAMAIYFIVNIVRW